MNPRPVFRGAGGIVPSFHLSEQWSGMRPWKPYNWRDFTIVTVGWEWDNCVSNFELTLGLVGLVLTLTWTWDGEGRRQLDEQFKEFQQALENGEVEVVE